MFVVRNADKPLTKEQLVSRFPDVFADGIGKIDGNNHICLDPSINPDVFWWHSGQNYR